MKDSIKYIKGDATSPIEEGNKVIVHICNDIGGWGRGFVMAISAKWKSPESKYREWAKSKTGFELGETQIVQVEEDLWIGNMIAQRGIKRSSNGAPPVRYESIDKCLETIRDFALQNNCSVHMPRIGCGLAGGQWKHIEPLIIKNLISKNIKVTVYDFE